MQTSSCTSSATSIELKESASSRRVCCRRMNDASKQISKQRKAPATLPEVTTSTRNASWFVPSLLEPRLEAEPASASRGHEGGSGGDEVVLGGTITVQGPTVAGASACKLLYKTCLPTCGERRTELKSSRSRANT